MIEEHNITTEETTENKIDLLKYVSKVQSRIKKDITGDFILAKLDETKREAIIEMTGNAYYMKKITDNIKNKAKTHEWDKKNKTWITRKLNTQEQNQIETIGNRIFDTYMNRLIMTAILNRNVTSNHLLSIISQTPQEQEEETDTATILKKLQTQPQKIE